MKTLRSLLAAFHSRLFPFQANGPRPRRLRFDQLEDRRVLALAAGDLDTSFGNDGEVTTDFGLVHSGMDNALAVAYQSDGKIVVLGGTDNSGATIARYNDDGSLDATFGAAGRVNADVFAGSFRGKSVAVDSAGRIVIAGSYGLNGGTDFGLLRLNSDGSFDTTFDGDGKQTIDFDGAGDFATSVVLDGAGRIVVAGYLGSGEVGADFAVSRLNPDGSLDTTFGTGGKQTVDFGSEYDERATSVAVDNDNRLIVAGNSYRGEGFIGPDYDFAVARLSSDGSLDTSFGASGKQLVDFRVSPFFGSWDILGGIAVDSAGRIVLAGTSAVGDAGGGFAVARLMSDGALDSAFSGDGKQVIDPYPAASVSREFAYLSLDSADRIVVAAGGSTANGLDFVLARFISNGSLDTTFSDDGIQVIDFGNPVNEFTNAVAVDGADRIVVAGLSQGETWDFALARLTESGQLDTTFSGDGKVLTDFLLSNDEAATDVAYQADGKLLVLGLSNYSSTAIARYNVDGSLDASFGTAGQVIIDPLDGPADFHYAVAVDSVGRIVVAGYSSGFSVGRLNNDGTWDTTFGDGGRQVLNGSYGFDSSFGLGMAVDSANRILIGGTITGSGPQGTGGTDFAVVRLNSDGQLDTMFGADGKQTVDFDAGDDSANSVVVDSAGRILISGVSYQAATGSDFAIARLNIDGSLDTTFGAAGKRTFDFGSTEDVARSLIVDSTDRVVVAGDTYQATTGFDFAVVRLTSAGQLDSSFSDGGQKFIDFGSASDRASGMAIDGTGRIVVAGSTVGEVTNDDFAVVRLNDDGTLDADFGEDGKQTIDSGHTWETGGGVIVDSSARIVIAGHSWSWSTGYDFALVRLIGSAPGGDADGDGIEDSIDTQPTTFSNDFSDIANGGATTGAITSRGDQVLTIVDAASSADGVLITADPSGGASPATISIDSGAGVLTLSSGDQVIATHGSVILNVIAGQIEATFISDAGQTVATAALAAGSDLTFEPDTVTFVAPPTNTQPVEVTLVGADGQEATATLSAENQITFEPESFSFSAPPTNTEPVPVVVNGNPITVAPGASVQPVQIDIRPSDSQSTVNLASNGIIAVAILSTADFDAREVLISSVVFAGAHATQSALQDVNGDGRLDLVLNFRTQDTNLRSLYELLLAEDANADGILDATHQTASVSLTGETIDEVLIEGFDDLDLFLAGRALRTLLDQLAASGAI